MSKRENFPGLREYTTFSRSSTTTPSLLKKMTDILVCLSHGIYSATEIATYCNYSISTVHRLLQELSGLGWLVHDEANRKYYMGSLIPRMAADYASSHRFLILHAIKEMNRLADLIGETVILGMLEQLHFVKLYDIPSRYNVKITEDDDKMKGQYIGATARVLLSQLQDNELKTLLNHISSNNNATGEAVDKKLLLKQINEIRRTGYAVSFGERITGSGCVSVPVKNYYYPLALYIVGPENRLKPQLELCIRELKTSAGIISEDIDGVFLSEEVESMK